MGWFVLQGWSLRHLRTLEGRPRHPGPQTRHRHADPHPQDRRGYLQRHLQVQRDQRVRPLLPQWPENTPGLQGLRWSHDC